MNGISAKSEQTISSKVIAEITGKQHSNVMQDVRNLLEQLGNEKGGLVFQLGSYLDSQNKQRPMYELSKKESLLLASGYNAILRLKIINRLEELEKQTVKLPTTFKDAILALGESLVREEQNQLLLEQANTKLDNLLEWISIVKVCGYNKVKETNFDWRVLKAKSQELDLPVKRAESPRFGYQNLYHVNCFKACYPKYEYDFQF